MFTKKKLNELMLIVNKICYSDKFKNAFLNKFKYLPSGLTYHIVENEETGKLTFYLVDKKYGYEHSFNNGITEGSDAYDFDVGDAEITDEMKDFVNEYFKHFETEFYTKYMI